MFFFQLYVFFHYIPGPTTFEFNCYLWNCTVYIHLMYIACGRFYIRNSRINPLKKHQNNANISSAPGFSCHRFGFVLTNCVASDLSGYSMSDAQTTV